MKRAATEEMAVEPYYERLAAQGGHYGPSFRGITSIARGENGVLGRVALDDANTAHASALLVHPALLDACFQLVGAGMPWALSSAPSDDDFCVPVGMAGYRVLRSGVTTAWCHVLPEPAADDAQVFRADVTLFDDAGAIVAELRQLEVRRTTRAVLRRALEGRTLADWAYEVEWPVLPLPGEAANTASGRWLVFADAGGVGSRLARQLEESGDAVVEVSAGGAFALDGVNGQIDPRDPEQFRRMLAETSQRDPRALKGVVFLWPLDETTSDSDATAMFGRHERLLGSGLHLAQALAEANTRLWFVTRGAQSVGGSLPDLAQAPAWGLAGVVASELPLLRCTRIDLDPTVREEEARVLYDSVVQSDLEDRVAWRGGQRHAARLVPVSVMPAGEAPRRLEITERGTLENLRLMPVERERPGSGQVEIRVHATGLNFRDVLNALGMYPGDPGPLGNECSGVITAIGEGVDDLQVGDDVLAMVDGAFATWVMAPAALTVRKPASLTHAEAATIPVTFLTAQYALHDLARIKKGTACSYTRSRAASAWLRCNWRSAPARRCSVLPGHPQNVRLLSRAGLITSPIRDHCRLLRT